MKKTHTSAIVIIPPKDKWTQIQKIRKEYDSQFNRWMPHINLIYPFIFYNDFLKLRETFITLGTKMKDFDISLNDLKYFNHGHQKFILWLDPEPEEPIIELQRKLLTIIPECNDLNRFKGGYQPHLSVGQVKNNENLKRVLETLQSNWQPIKFSIESIFIIERDQESTASFKIKDEITFRES